MRGAHRQDELVDCVILGEVARTACLDGLSQHHVVGRRGEHHDLGVGPIGLDLTGRVHTIAVGEAIVHEHDVGLGGARRLNPRLGRGLGGGDGDVVGLVEGGAESLREHPVVLDDEHADLALDRRGHLSIAVGTRE